MKKLEIFLLFIFIFCSAFSTRAQNDCDAVLKKSQLPAGNLIISEIKQAFRNEIEELPLYRSAFQEFYNYEYCMRPASSNVAAVLAEVKKQAKDRFIKYFDLKPNSSESSVILAGIELLDGERQKAEKLVDEAISLDNKNFEAYFIKGFINFRTETGLQNVEEAIRLNNNFAAAHALKAEILLNLAGKTGAAATTTTPDEQKAYYEQAMKSAQKYLQLAPGFSKNTNFWQEQTAALKLVLGSFEHRQKNPPPTSPPAAENKTLLKLKTRPRANYTELARMSATEGTVRVRVWFGADGQVKNVLVLQGVPFGLNYQAVIAARLIEFEPPTQDGKPYPVIKIVEYMFTLF